LLCLGNTLCKVVVFGIPHARLLCTCMPCARIIVSWHILCKVIMS
jgi:hypothetical protein